MAEISQVQITVITVFDYNQEKFKQNTNEEKLMRMKIRSLLIAGLFDQPTLLTNVC